MHFNFNVINKLKYTPVVHLTCPPPRILSRSKGFKGLASCFSSQVIRLDVLCEFLFSFLVKYCLNMEVSYEV